MDKSGSKKSFKTNIVNEDRLNEVIPLMLDADNDDWPEHQGLKRQIFGFEGGIKKETYLQRVTAKPCNWILSSKDIRKRLIHFNNEATIEALNE